MDPSTDWRQTGRYLRVDARAGRVGIIEDGHGCIAIDDQGEVRGRFTTFDLPQTALA